jgi:hypothetical protein
MSRYRPGENTFTEECGTVNSRFTIKIEMLLGWRVAWDSGVYAILVITKGLRSEKLALRGSG